MIPSAWAEPRRDDELLQLFRDDEGMSEIQDEYQRGLYMKQGLAAIAGLPGGHALSLSTAGSAHGRMV